MDETEVIKPVFTLIDKKVTLQAEREKVKRSIMDILNAPNTLVSIDINAVKNFFQECGAIHAFNVSVEASKENRMMLIKAQIMKSAKCFEPYHHALVFFFFPEEHHLQMEELQQFSDWIDSVPGELTIQWGMATQSTQELRAIILLQ